MSTATIELTRFFQVAQELDGERGEMAKMPAGIVDQHWHELIESGALDALVSNSLGAGVRVDHIEAGGVDPLNWVDRYEAEFGALSPLWFTDADGRLDQETYDRYLGGDRQVKMSWDCGPAFVTTTRD